MSLLCRFSLHFISAAAPRGPQKNLRSDERKQKKNNFILLFCYKVILRTLQRVPRSARCTVPDGFMGGEKRRAEKIIFKRINHGVLSVTRF